MSSTRRQFYLIDEATKKRTRVTLKQIADHFNGDGTGPVRWNKDNVDLERFRFEMSECGYRFEIRRNGRVVNMGRRMSGCR